MRYTKGRRGPESTNSVSIQFIKKDGTDDNPMAKGIMNVHLQKGNRMVSFLAQGKNAKSLIEAHANDGDMLNVKMRWTGREAVTITGIVVNVDVKGANKAA